MQNFTLRRNGMSLFLFAFILFSGTYSYGQTCPTVSQTTVSYCDAELMRVEDLSPQGADIAWYISQDSTTPLSATSLLKSTVYYVGTTDQSCVGSREQVSVTIYGPPILNINKAPSSKQATGDLSYCMDPNSEPLTLADIQSNVPVNWYSTDLTKDSANDTPLPLSTELVPGEYYAGRSDVGCLTTRSKLVVKSPLPPTAYSDQNYCELSNPTLADIRLSGTRHRFYESAEDLIALDPTTPLVDGFTYYISSNDDCESEGRTAVTVNVIQIAVTSTVQSFCASQGTGQDLVRPTVGQLETPEGEDPIWYDNLEDQKNGIPPLDNNSDLIDQEDYYLHIPEGECSTTKVVVELTPAPNAGIDTQISFCSNDTSSHNLIDRIKASPDFGAADRTGSFDPAVENNEFIPEEWGAGVYTFQYTVEPTAPCAEPSVSTLEVTVNEAPDAGSSPETVLCYADIMTQDNFNSTLDSLLEERNTNGVLSPSREELFAQISAEGNVTATYEANFTVEDTTTGCQDTATLTFNIQASPNAGVGPAESVSLCAVEPEVDLLDYLSDSVLGAPDLGGTITPTLSGGGTIFDPAVDEAGEYTYTVSNENCGEDTAIITIEIIPQAYAGEDSSLDFCAYDDVQNLYDRIEELGISTAGTFSNYPDGQFNPSQVGPGEYTTVYTVEPIENCGTSHQATYTLVVNDIPNAPAPTTDITDCAITGLTVADLVATPDTGNSIQWYTDAALTTPAATTDVLVTGTYYATQTSPAGCESAATPADVVINDAPTPTLVQGGNQFCMIDRPTVGSIAMNEANVTWYDSATGGSIVNPETGVQNGDVYYASLTDAASGCESSQRLAVTAEVEKCPLPIPEAFSPNGDGINDRFMVEFIGEQYPQFTIEIFNRWGQKVFKGNATNATWNGESSEGSIGSDVVPVGVYFYVIDYNDGETPPSQGRLYLSR